MKTVKDRRLVLTGGGTAGHVFPLIALAWELRKTIPKLELLYLGTADGPERAACEKAAIPFRAISAGKLRRWLTFENLADLVRTIGGIAQSIQILRAFKPALIFAKGGYVSFPVLAGAVLLRIPIFLHESDAVLGLVNRLAAPFARQIFTGFPENSYPPSLRQRLLFVGVPVRQEFLAAKPPRASSPLPLLLFMGGSQGAHALNLAVFELLPKLLPHARILHLTGPLDFRGAKIRRGALLPHLRRRYFPFEFLAARPLASAMAEATLVISRAGANALAELAATGKPTILIPLPKPPAAFDHQLRNARFFEEHGAAMIVEQTGFFEAELLKVIPALLADSQKRAALSKAIKRLAKANAARRIGQEIQEFLSA